MLHRAAGPLLEELVVFEAAQAMREVPQRATPLSRSSKAPLETLESTFIAISEAWVENEVVPVRPQHIDTEARVAHVPTKKLFRTPLRLSGSSRSHTRRNASAARRLSWPRC